VVEIDEEYCMYALKRLEQAEVNQTIQGYFDSVFWERNSFSMQKPSDNDKSQ